MFACFPDERALVRKAFPSQRSAFGVGRQHLQDEYEQDVLLRHLIKMEVLFLLWGADKMQNIVPAVVSSLQMCRLCSNKH